jgi:hypothetical protein
MRSRSIQTAALMAALAGMPVAVLNAAMPPARAPAPAPTRRHEKDAATLAKAEAKRQRRAEKRLRAASKEKPHG